MRLTKPGPTDLLSMDADVADLSILTMAMTHSSTAGEAIYRRLDAEAQLQAFKSGAKDLLVNFNSPQIGRISRTDEKIKRGEKVERTVEYESLIIRDLDLPPFQGTLEELKLAKGENSEKTSKLDDNALDTDEVAGSHRGRIVGNAQLKFLPKDWVNQLPKPDIESHGGHSESGVDMELGIAFESEFRKLQETHLGGIAHYHHDQLGTISTHLGRGIAKSLTKWILDHAERDQVPVFLFSSPIGLGYHKKNGFAEIGHVDIDLKNYGGNEVFRHIAMIWYPPKKNDTNEQDKEIKSSDSTTGETTNVGTKHTEAGGIKTKNTEMETAGTKGEDKKASSD